MSPRSADLKDGGSGSQRHTDRGGHRFRWPVAGADVGDDCSDRQQAKPGSGGHAKRWPCQADRDSHDTGEFNWTDEPPMNSATVARPVAVDESGHAFDDGARSRRRGEYTLVMAPVDPGLTIFGRFWARSGYRSGRYGPRIP